MYARVAELVDALVSGTSIRKDVQVQVLFRVHTTKINLYKLKHCRGLLLKGDNSRVV